MGGGCPPASSLCLILEPNGRSDLKGFFMDRCPKDEPTDKNLVCEKAPPIPEKNWKNLLGWYSTPPPPPPLGHRRVKMTFRHLVTIALSVLRHLKIVHSNF